MRLVAAVVLAAFVCDYAAAQPLGAPVPAEAVRPIDLDTALRLANVDNPEIRIARERVFEATALRQHAAAQFLPTINAGSNYDHHQGTLQDSSGNILKVNRDALYVGLGASAIGAGTVNIPGIVWSANVSDVWYGNLISKQVVRQRRFESEAVRNSTLMAVSAAYMELLRAAGRHAVAAAVRVDAAEVARLTANHAKAGTGRQSDADRARTELQQRDADVVHASGDLKLANARLCQLLNLDPSVQLMPMEERVVPGALVPDTIPLPELLAIAVTQRPELGAQRAAVRAALLEMRHMKVLPFAPTVLVGYSAGTFGGGSNLVEAGIPQPNGTVLQQPRFGSFADREDVDVVMFWSLRNLGVGNVALIKVASSQFRQSQLRELETLDRIRAEVASAQARLLARGGQIDFYEKAIRSSQNAYTQDLKRVRNEKGLVIELVDSVRLMGRSRYGYVDAIVDYNRAQFELYVALGQPPANTLARPVPLGAPEPTEK
jgi:outer membrane protein TolC